MPMGSGQQTSAQEAAAEGQRARRALRKSATRMPKSSASSLIFSACSACSGPSRSRALSDAFLVSSHLNGAWSSTCGNRAAVRMGGRVHGRPCALGRGHWAVGIGPWALGRVQWRIAGHYSCMGQSCVVAPR